MISNFEDYYEFSFDNVISYVNNKYVGCKITLFGSSYGLDDSLRKRADVTFSLSDFTFTHYMALLLTTEQVYRSMKIMRGETYDK